MPYNHNYQPKVDKAVVSAVKTAFQRSLTSPRNWLAHQSGGRVDTRNVWRNAATGDRNIFRERLAPGAAKVNVHILVDGSTSMDSRDKHKEGDDTTRIQHAADITATLTDAFRSQALVRLHVWMHNSQAEKLAVYPVVTNGQGREHIGKMVNRTSGGNGDGYILHWLGEKLRRQHRHGEVDLIIVVSDGLPSWVWSQHTSEGKYAALSDSEEMQAQRKNAVALMFNEVESLRDHGVQVLSVAIAPNPNQVEMFGEAGVIPFTGDWNKLAVEFGTALGRTLNSAGETKRKGTRR